MNKQLIIRYFEEFKHWLDGGKLLHKDVFNNWENSGDIWDLKAEQIKAVIINDELVEYRKALAEGKVVEFRHPQVGFTLWEIVTPEHLFQSLIVPGREYRIKPEPPNFKVGDWVILNGKHKRVTKAVDGYIDSLDNQVAVIMKEESLELWKPENEKYFWYKNDLVRFHETQTNLGLLLESARGCSYYTAEENFEDYCEPFIGQLPTTIKFS